MGHCRLSANKIRPLRISVFLHPRHLFRSQQYEKLPFYHSRHLTYNHQISRLSMGPRMPGSYLYYEQDATSTEVTQSSGRAISRSTKTALPLQQVLKRHETVLMNNAATESFISPGKPATSEQSDSLFLTMLPLEVREKIYMLLISSPALGECTISSDGHVIRPDSYGLFPQISRTCRRINGECDKVLYELTTFSMVLVPYLVRSIWDKKQIDLDMVSPLTRYSGQWPFSKPLFLFRDLAALRKVRRWRVVICPLRNDGFPRYPYRDLETFCRATVRSPVLKVLEIIIVHARVECLRSRTLHVRYH